MDAAGAGRTCRRDARRNPAVSARACRYDGCGRRAASGIAGAGTAAAGRRRAVATGGSQQGLRAAAGLDASRTSRAGRCFSASATRCGSRRSGCAHAGHRGTGTCRHNGCARTANARTRAAAGRRDVAPRRPEQGFRAAARLDSAGSERRVK